MQTLYDNTTETEKSCVATILGFTGYSEYPDLFCGYRNNLRNIEYTDNIKTIGDIKKAYLKFLTERA